MRNISEMSLTPSALCSANDSLTSSGGRATLSGGRGNDTLGVTGNNNSILYAKGDGTDHVATGGSDNDLLAGGEGDDSSYGELEVRLSAHQLKSRRRRDGVTGVETANDQVWRYRA